MIPRCENQHARLSEKMSAKVRVFLVVQMNMPLKLDNQAHVNALWSALDPEDAERLELHRLINGLSRYDYVMELLKESLQHQADHDGDHA
jgi:hypothetical protein